MDQKYKTYLIKALVIFIIILEGTGIYYGRQLSFGLIILFPALLYIIGIGYYKKIDVPKYLGILIILFITTLIISVFLSTNIALSISFAIFYIGCLATLIIVNDTKKIVAHALLPVIFGIGIFLCIYRILLVYFPPIVPLNGYQLVSSFYGSHNHLGDFLILPLTAIFYILMNKNNKIHPLILLLLSIFFAPYFLFSFSRSAYFSVIVTLIFMFYYFVKKGRIRLIEFRTLLMILVICILTLFMFSVSIFSSQKNLVSEINTHLVENNNLSYKAPFGARGEYVREAILAIFYKPIFGVGPGNFIEISKKYNPIQGLWAESSHNLFLNIMVEDGIAAGLILFIIIVEIFRKSEKNIYFFMALALLINFQTDYTFRIYSLFFLFFVLCGLCQQKES